MPGVNSILDIGRLALFANQSALEVTGNNIANVNTPGYSRQTVRLEDGISVDFRPGQIGTGVRAKEVIRHFDEFIEKQYNEKSSDTNRYSALYGNLKSLDSLFNESITPGINNSLSTFWEKWQDLTNRPEDYSAREALLGSTQNFLNGLKNAAEDIARMQSQMDDFISQEVDEVNGILAEVAELNLQISSHDVPGQNNANSLFDRRATLVRSLAEKMDVNVIDNGGGDFTILTKAGQVLVDKTQVYAITFEGPRTMKDLLPSSAFDGNIYFSGSDDFEYTVEVLSGGYASSANSATFRVSLDGGVTWLKDEDGNELAFSAHDESQKVLAGDLYIWFGQASNSGGTATQQLTAGDRFTIVPKSGLYWYETTSTAINITPQIDFTGRDNERRLTGGSLTGYFNFRDNYVGRYKERLDAFAKTMSWEVNRLHSQGAGLQKFSEVTGTFAVTSDTSALGSAASGLGYYDKLQSGGCMMHIYNASTGALASAASFGPLDFGAAAGIQNFNPATMSLTDVRDAVNRTYGGYVTATIVNHELKITANSGYEFALGTDTTGLYAALGINTFFEGDTALDLKINAKIQNDLDYICAGHVNGAGEANAGDNTQAVAIAQLQSAKVQFSTAMDGKTTQTLQGYFNGIVATVGADTATTKFNFEYNKSLADDLSARQEEMAGVNLDEEMSNLVKFQASYTAAAKLIQTADRMLQTVLGLKN
ncbi:MAG: flagellar hook-associated protein FlgK [Thermodesulfobacteriota bacterium]